jgi:hypothetical protein
MARPEIAQLVQSGAQMGLGLMQEKRMRDVFGLEQDKFAIEQEAAGAINSVAQGEAEFSKKRGAGAQVLGEIRKLSAMDPAVRKSQAPVVFQALESATGKPLADNLKQFILSAKPEIAGPVVDKLLRGYSQDPSQTLDNLNDLLSNPLASANAIGQISRDLGDVAAQESLTGPTANPRRNKFNEQKASIERRIAGYEQAIQRYPQSKSAETAQREVDRLRGNLEKMENILSVQEASAMGVRPGTTLTESGTGNVAVLQGPDDSGDGGSLSGLKPSEINTLLKMAGQEFESEINLQTGEINFKNRSDGVVANQWVTDAGRIYLDAGGKLTLPEAYQLAKKKAGAGAAGGTADLNDPYAGF